MALFDSAYYFSLLISREALLPRLLPAPSCASVFVAAALPSRLPSGPLLRLYKNSGQKKI